MKINPLDVTVKVIMKH
ncbi:Protein of unknown function [Lactobacillus helveticus CIRM-BIA 101]|nr:Protein of unknown function [Lactobacillus helveticus CIRM-BIA 101]